jgi:hypothetical protein
MNDFFSLDYLRENASSEVLADRLYARAARGDDISRQVVEMMSRQFEIAVHFFEQAQQWKVKSMREGEKGIVLIPCGNTDGWEHLHDLLVWCLENR